MWLRAAEVVTADAVFSLKGGCISLAFMVGNPPFNSTRPGHLKFYIILSKTSSCGCFMQYCSDLVNAIWYNKCTFDAVLLMELELMIAEFELHFCHNRGQTCIFFYLITSLLPCIKILTVCNRIILFEILALLFCQQGHLVRKFKQKCY